MAKDIPRQKLGKNNTIVIVEDDPINARVCSKMLRKRRGCNVKHTEDVEEVLQIAQSGQVDLILMDVSLSHSVYRGKAVDGIKITQMLKSDPRTADIPVILWTAQALEGDRKKFLKESGADDFITKGGALDHERFVDQIEHCISITERGFEAGLKIIRKFGDQLLLYEQEKNSNLLTENLVLKEVNWSLRQIISEAIKQLQENPGIQAEVIQKIQKRLDNQLKDIQKLQENPANSANEESEKYQAICSSVAHSLRGEFMNMGSSIQAIRELADTSSDVQEECDLMYRSLEYSQILLRQLLDYLDIGKPSIEAIDVLELIRKVELLARPRLPSRIELEILIDSSWQEQKVLGNFEQLMSVLLELIKNATKALRQQGGKIELCIARKNSEIAISVKDNGAGISEEVKDKLFKETVYSQSGLGLGLFVSNKVINELGGKLDLETSHNEGTKVTILLPIA
jgi:signal transduction histidine kinase